MKIKKLLAIVTVLALCFSFSLPAFAAGVNGPGTDTAATGSVSLSSELQAKENEANDKYNKLLSFWACDSEYVNDSDADFPSFYSGAYIDGQKNLVIQVTILNDGITAYFSKIIDLSNVIFEEVKHSYDELKAAHAAIVEKLDPTSKDEVISSISGVGISFRNNAVNLYVVTSEANARSMNFLQKVKKEISPFDHIQVIATSGKDVPCASVEPGTEIKNGTFSRSVGFWAYDANNNLGLITAPHDSAAAGDTMKIGIRTFGTAGTPSYSGSVDAVFIERTNTYFTATRYVSGWGFNLTSNGHTTLAVGSTTYSKGITSGCHMGGGR